MILHIYACIHIYICKEKYVITLFVYVSFSCSLFLPMLPLLCYGSLSSSSFTLLACLFLRLRISLRSSYVLLTFDFIVCFICLILLVCVSCCSLFIICLPLIVSSYVSFPSFVFLVFFILFVSFLFFIYPHSSKDLCCSYYVMAMAVVMIMNHGARGDDDDVRSRGRRSETTLASFCTIRFIMNMLLSRGLLSS